MIYLSRVKVLHLLLMFYLFLIVFYCILFLVVINYITINNTKIYHYFRDNVCLISYQLLYNWALLIINLIFDTSVHKKFLVKLHKRTSWGVKLQSLENIICSKLLMAVKFMLLTPAKLHMVELMYLMLWNSIFILCNLSINTCNFYKGRVILG